MKVCWLAPYNLSLLPELKSERKISSHPCTWIVNLSNELSKNSEIELHIITSSPAIPSDQVIEKGNVRFYVLKYSFPFTSRGFPPYLPFDVLTKYFSLNKKIGSYLKKINPDIIHVYGTEYAYGLAALKTNYPSIIFIQGIINEYKKINWTIFFMLQSRIENYVIKNSKHFGSGTKWADNYIRTNNNSAEIHYMPEAVNNIFFEKNPQRENQNILFVGSLEKRKGIETALDAFQKVIQKFPDCILLIVGSGKESYMKFLKSKSEELKIAKNIKWLGTKNANELAELHSESSIFIHPSFIDNSPNAVVEAMTSGLAIIASDVGGIRSLIDENETGLLFETQNYFELADKIIFLLNNHTEIKRLGDNAKRIAMKKNLPCVVSKITLDVYKKILEIKG